jgi:hypothetical protein
MKYNEHYFVQKLALEWWCQREVTLLDGSRCDLLSTPTSEKRFVAEVDWPHKWSEGLGQVLLYAALTAMPPILVLLVSNDFQKKYVWRARIACKMAGVELREVNTKELRK